MNAVKGKIALALAGEKPGHLHVIHVMEDVEARCWEYMRNLHPELTPGALKAMMIESILQCEEADRD